MNRFLKILKNRYTICVMVVFVAAVCLLMAFILMSNTGIVADEPDDHDIESTADESNAGENIGENGSDEELNIRQNSEWPTFLVRDIDTVKLNTEFAIEDYYVRNRLTYSNRFYLDEEGVFWGSGRNEYGQMGTGTYGEDEYYAEPVKIAENVVSIDASWNNYFCIFLTDNGELYGIGSNMIGLLGEECTGEVASEAYYTKIPSPVLLMENVEYARAGRECIVALKNDGSVWWWGQYRTTTSTEFSRYADYWKVEEDDKNPAKMLYTEPRKILDNCIYATTGDWTGAAITEKGDLYTWGLNIFGECGTPVTEDDFVRTPVKVLENVKMVWPENIRVDDTQDYYSDFVSRDFVYGLNTFVELRSHTIMAAGENLGDKISVTEVTGDTENSVSHTYSDTFVPVNLVEYPEAGKREVLNTLTWGMSIDEVEEVFNSSGVRSSGVYSGDGGMLCGLSIEDGRYYAYFDEAGGLNEFVLQEGGSRNKLFTIGMEYSELEDIVAARPDGELMTGETRNYESFGGISEVKCYLYNDTDNNIQYEFSIKDDKLCMVYERKIR